jgi:hypothetical protein
MSYLTGEPGLLPGFKKAVISLWFRIPKASIDAAAKTYVKPEKQKEPGYFTYLVIPDPRMQAYQIDEGIPNYPPKRKPFNGVIPLITFGKPSRRYFQKISVEYTGNHYMWEWAWSSPSPTSTPRSEEEKASDLVAIHETLGPFDETERGPWGWPKPGSSPDIIPFPQERLSAQAAPPHGVGATPVEWPDVFPDPPDWVNWPGQPGTLGAVGSVGYWSTFASPILISHFTPKYEWVNHNESGDVEVTEPSYIGILCKDGGASLDIKLQTLEHAEVKARGWIARVLSPDMDFYQGNLDEVPTREYVHHVIFEDTMATITGPDDDAPGPKCGFEHEYFSGGGASVSPDHWHHLLLSFDISLKCETGPCTRGNEDTGPYNVPSAAKMWIAFDDQNQEKGGLSPFWANSGEDAAKNDVLSSTGDEFKKNHQFTPEERTTSVVDYPMVNKVTHIARDEGCVRLDEAGGEETMPPSSKFTAGNLPDGPIGIPSHTKYVDNIYHCEMAELQVFLDVTLDTKEEQNRRAFIDKDGKPVPPNQKEKKDAKGNVIKPAGSIERLGKKPEILLHRSSNWEKGKNTGVKIDEGTGKEKPTGDFQATGLVLRYKPDPSLGGPQKPAGEK